MAAKLILARIADGSDSQQQQQQQQQRESAEKNKNKTVARCVRRLPSQGIK